jgi:hypothetical protein
VPQFKICQEELSTNQFEFDWMKWNLLELKVKTWNKQWKEKIFNLSRYITRKSTLLLFFAWRSYAHHTATFFGRRDKTTRWDDDDCISCIEFIREKKNTTFTRFEKLIFSILALKSFDNNLSFFCKFWLFFASLPEALNKENIEDSRMDS